MGLKDEDWRQDALNAYREAHTQLTQLKAMRRGDMSYFIEDIAEVLLDLKQSVIDADPASAWKAMIELDELRADLRDYLAGD
jgi:hypothetical protein